MSKTTRMALLAVITLLLLPATAFSQQSSFTIKGQIYDGDNDSQIAFATISLIDQDSIPVTAAAADASGKFTLKYTKAGIYDLTVTYIGFVEHRQQVELESERNIDLGRINLTQGIEIEGVAVVTQKPLIVVHSDKMTYNLEADPEAATSTLVEIFRKVPQISVDAEDNIRLNGKEDYKVLVNGKSSGMLAKNFAEVVKSMPANSIKEIEVITNPSTKYEAEGAGGIINIITNRSTMNGYSGNVNFGGDSEGSFSWGSYVSAQLGKFSMSANYWGNRHRSPASTYLIERTSYESDNYHHSVTDGRGEWRNISNMLSLEASYEIDTLNLISLSLWGYTNKAQTLGHINSATYNRQGELYNGFHNYLDTRNDYGTLSGSLDYERSFRRPEQSFTLSYKFEYVPDNYKHNNTVDQTVNYTPEVRFAKSKAHGTEHTVQLDYYDPITKKHNVEAGLKYIMRRNVSDTYNFIEVNGSMVDDPNRWNDNLDYDQHIFGAYAGYVFKLEKFTAKGGMRAEGAWNLGSAETRSGPLKFDNSSFNFIPYVNLGYTISQKQNVNISYTQRLMRPGIWQLNPYRDESDPQNVRLGNPDLKAVVNHNFSANWSLFVGSWNFFVGANSSFSNNSISNLTTLYPDTGVAESKPDNIGKTQNHGGWLSFSYRLNSRLSVNANGGFNYTKLVDAQRELSNEGVSSNAYLGVTVELWKDARFYANGGLYGGWVQIQGQSPYYHWSSFGLTQSLFKKKVDLSVTISDPFTKYRTWKNNIDDPAFRSRSENRNVARRLHYRASYRFGKMDVSVKKARRTISNDDRMDSGSGGGGGGQ